MIIASVPQRKSALIVPPNHKQYQFIWPMSVRRWLIDELRERGQERVTVCDLPRPTRCLPFSHCVCMFLSLTPTVCPSLSLCLSPSLSLCLFCLLLVSGGIASRVVWIWQIITGKATCWASGEDRSRHAPVSNLPSTPQSPPPSQFNASDMCAYCDWWMRVRSRVLSALRQIA